VDLIGIDPCQPISLDLSAVGAKAAAEAVDRILAELEAN
jgi:hypothetical protein